MLRVGVTGPVASGKSSVARRLEAGGLPRIDADRVAHDLYRPGSALVEELARAFGESILDPAGHIDRRRLGAIVFADASARERLNAIVHPPLVAEIGRRLARLAAAGAPAAVLEAALLLQWTAAGDRPGLVDLVVGVTAPRETRRARLVAAGLPGVEAERRLDAQVDEARLAEACDVLLVNDGSREELDRKVDRLLRDLRKRAGIPDGTDN